jgi:uncharacterized protein RhaS with RHS repeats
VSGGFLYNYFRDYNPKTGKYIESDPIGLKGGINTYSYVGNSPSNRSDPLGLFDGSTFFSAARTTATSAGVGALGSLGAFFAAMAPTSAGEGSDIVPSRDIWWPEKTPGKWTCKARADCNDNIPGNCPEDPKRRQAFGGGVASDLGTARNIAKSNATSNLQCQPKHVSCKCTGPKGEQYSRGC